MKKILLVIPQATSFNTFLRELVIGLKKKRFKVYAVFHDKSTAGAESVKLLERSVATAISSSHNQ
jgi:hypothetical protein